MSIRTRVQDSFRATVENATDPVEVSRQVRTYEQLVKCMDYAREALRETHAQMRRSLLLALLAVLAFVVIQTRTLEKLSLGSIEITQKSSLIIFIPTFALFLFLEVAIKQGRADQQARIASECFRLWNSKAYDRDLEIILEPEPPFYLASVTRAPKNEHASTYDRLVDGVSMSLLFVVFLVPVAFVVYAFVQLFASHGAQNWLVWGNLVASVCLLVIFSWTFWASADDAGARPPESRAQ